MLNTVSQVSSMPLVSQSIGVLASDVDLSELDKGSCISSSDSINSPESILLKESLMSDDAGKGIKCSKIDSKKGSKSFNAKLYNIEGDQATETLEQLPKQGGKLRRKVQYSEAIAGTAQSQKSKDGFKDSLSKPVSPQTWLKKGEAPQSKAYSANGAHSNVVKHGTLRHQWSGAESSKLGSQQKSYDDRTAGSSLHSKLPMHKTQQHDSNLSNGSAVTAPKQDNPSNRLQGERKSPVNILPTDSSNPRYSTVWPGLDCCKPTVSTCGQDNEKESKHISTENSLKSQSDDNQNNSTGSKKISWLKIEVHPEPHHLNPKRSYNHEYMSSQGRRPDLRHKGFQGSRSSKRSTSASDPHKRQDSHAVTSDQKNESQSCQSDSSQKNVYRDQKMGINSHAADSSDKFQPRKSSNAYTGPRRVSAKSGSATQQDRNTAADSQTDAEGSNDRVHFDSFSKHPVRHRTKQNNGGSELGLDQKNLDPGSQQQNAKCLGNQGAKNSQGYQLCNSRLKGTAPGWTKFKRTQRRIDQSRYGISPREGFSDLPQHSYAPMSPNIGAQITGKGRYPAYKFVPYVKNDYDDELHYSPVRYMIPQSRLDIDGLNQIKQSVRKQVEYYLSVDNLCKDVHLRRNMNPKDGSVSVYLISKFNRMAVLMSVAAAKASSVIAYSLASASASACDAEEQDQSKDSQPSQRPGYDHQQYSLIAGLELPKCQNIESFEWVQDFIVLSLSGSQVVETLLHENDGSAHLRPVNDWHKWPITTNYDDGSGAGEDTVPSTSGEVNE